MRSCSLLFISCCLFSFESVFAYYSPQQGRWISRDPIEEDGGVNLYAHTQNNPINRIDTDGCATFPWIKKPAWTASFHNHFEKLKSRLIKEMRRMCPESKEIEWKPTYLKNPICCKRKNCLKDTEKFAIAYIAAIKEVWLLEYLTHGNVLGGLPGNARLDNIGGAGTYYGDNYADAFDGHGLRCGGWSELGEKTGDSIFGTCDNCFEQRQKVKKKVLGNHATYLIKSATGKEKVLDPWLSGGWWY